MKSDLGEFSSGGSVCRNKRTWSDLGAPFLPGVLPGRGIQGALPPPLITPTYMWREHAKAKAHIHAIYVKFLEIIIVFPNGGQWASCSKSPPPLFKPLVTPLLGRCHTVCVRRKVPPRLDVNKGGTVPSPQTGFAGLSLPPKLQPPN